MTLDEKIELVTSDMLNRFPNCFYTIFIILWNDGTDCVECRHGTYERLFVSKYYNNELTFNEFDIENKHLIVDAVGNQTYNEDQNK